METLIRLGVYREYEGDSGGHARALELHNRRRDALHEALDSDSVQVKDWGATDDTQPHEFVEITLLFLSPVATHLAAEGLKYLGKKMADKAIDESTSEIVKWIITKLRKPQEEKKIRDLNITLPSGAFITVNPPENGEVKIMFSGGDVASITYR